jgi:hypothetical protein
MLVNFVKLCGTLFFVSTNSISNSLYARTKQTAREGKDGTAPRKQLAARKAGKSAVSDVKSDPDVTASEIDSSSDSEESGVAEPTLDSTSSESEDESEQPPDTEDLDVDAEVHKIVKKKFGTQSHSKAKYNQAFSEEKRKLKRRLRYQNNAEGRMKCQKRSIQHAFRSWTTAEVDAEWQKRKDAGTYDEFTPRKKVKLEPVDSAPQVSLAEKRAKRKTSVVKPTVPPTIVSDESDTEPELKSSDTSFSYGIALQAAEFAKKSLSSPVSSLPTAAVSSSTPVITQGLFGQPLPSFVMPGPIIPQCVMATLSPQPFDPSCQHPVTLSWIADQQHLYDKVNTRCQAMENAFQTFKLDMERRQSIFLTSLAVVPHRVPGVPSEDEVARKAKIFTKKYAAEIVRVQGIYPTLEEFGQRLEASIHNLKLDEFCLYEKVRKIPASRDSRFSLVIDERIHHPLCRMVKLNMTKYQHFDPSPTIDINKSKLCSSCSHLINPELSMESLLKTPMLRRIVAWQNGARKKVCEKIVEKLNAITNNLDPIQEEQFKRFEYFFTQVTSGVCNDIISALDNHFDTAEWTDDIGNTSGEKTSVWKYVSLHKDLLNTHWKGLLAEFTGKWKPNFMCLFYEKARFHGKSRTGFNQAWRMISRPTLLLEGDKRILPWKIILPLGKMQLSFKRCKKGENFAPKDVKELKDLTKSAEYETVGADFGDAIFISPLSIYSFNATPKQTCRFIWGWIHWFRLHEYRFNVDTLDMVLDSAYFNKFDCWETNYVPIWKLMDEKWVDATKERGELEVVTPQIPYEPFTPATALQEAVNAEVTARKSKKAKAARTTTATPRLVSQESNEQTVASILDDLVKSKSIIVQSSAPSTAVTPRPLVEMSKSGTARLFGDWMVHELKDTIMGLYTDLVWINLIKEGEKTHKYCRATLPPHQWILLRQTQQVRSCDTFIVVGEPIPDFVEDAQDIKCGYTSDRKVAQKIVAMVILDEPVDVVGGQLPGIHAIVEENLATVLTVLNRALRESQTTIPDKR